MTRASAVNQIDKIILVVSPDIVNDEAVERASSFARAHDAQVTVLGVVDHEPSLWPGADLDVNDMIVGAHRAKLEATVKALRQQAVAVESRVRIGVPVIEIILEVLGIGADVVIQMAEGAESDGTSLAGSVHRLVRKCPCPVWATKPRERIPYKKIVAAVDPTDDRTGSDPMLNTKILRWASDIARTDGAELVVLHAWPTMDIPPFMSPKQLQRVTEDSEKLHLDNLDQLLNSLDLGDLVPERRLAQGHPSVVIPQTVASQRADLLVMGTVARTGIRGFLMGNTAEKVIASVECSMLTVKPDGFVSPVQGD